MARDCAGSLSVELSGESQGGCFSLGKRPGKVSEQMRLLMVGLGGVAAWGRGRDEGDGDDDDADAAAAPAC